MTKGASDPLFIGVVSAPPNIENSENIHSDAESQGVGNVAPVFRFGLFKRQRIRTSTGKLYVTLTCSICNQSYKHPKHANTTSLKYHFRKKHAKYLSELGEKAHEDIKMKRRELGDTILGTDLLVNLEVGETPITDFLPAKKQSSNQSSRVTKKRKREFDPAVFRSLFIESLVENNIPFDVCDNPKTKAYLNYARTGSEKLVSLPQITNSIKKTYDREIRDLKKVFAAHDGRFALTLNEWKTTNRYKFLGITLHFHDDSFTLRNYTIGIEVLIGKKKHQDLVMEHLSKVLSDYDIKDRIISITRENDEPMNTLLKDFSNHYGLPYFKGDIRCVGHILNLSSAAILDYTFFRSNKSLEFVESIEKIQMENLNLSELSLSMKTLPGTIRQIVKGVLEVGLIKNTFAEILANRKKIEAGPETLLMDSKTNDLSTFNMLDRFIYFREEINILLSNLRALKEEERDLLDLDVFQITDIEWDYLSNLVKILFVYQEATMSLQAPEKTTIHMTIPYMCLLLDDLRSLDTYDLRVANPWLSEGLLYAREKIYQFYPIMKGECGDELLNLFSTTVLDPRLKLHYFREWGFSEPVIEKIKKHLCDIYSRYKKEYDEENSKGFARPSLISEPGFQLDFGHSRLFREVYSMMGKTPNGDDNNELTTYLSEPKARPRDIAEFYRNLKDSSPVLYRIAKDYLAIPAMSTPSKVLFSQIKDIISNKKDRSLPELTGYLAFLKSIGKLPGSGKKSEALKGGAEVEEESGEESEEESDEEWEKEWEKELAKTSDEDIGDEVDDDIYGGTDEVKREKIDNWTDYQACDKGGENGSKSSTQNPIVLDD